MATVGKTGSAKKVTAKPKGPTARSVLTMTAKQARAHFLKPKSYCKVELPPYFDFGRVLRPVSKLLDKTTLASASSKPRDHEDVNYSFYSNKDGKYAWRPYQLIHPAIYVDLTRQITEPVAWKLIQDRFGEFATSGKIKCLSIPIESKTKKTDQAAQVLTWWQGVEQASIELALDYNHVFYTDIADCYASIYTHSIVWALHTRSTAKAKKGDKSLVGNVIDTKLQDMQQGQTNGIPQGSVLMDLFAEMVLGYADLELSTKLASDSVSEYQILRYRDDYRIFVNSPEIGERILRTLTEVLLALGLKLSPSKTSSALPVIPNALKIDKKQWMRGRQGDQSLQKHLLLIHYHSNEFPNAGSLLSALDEFYRRLIETKTVENTIQMISIAADIGFGSPRCFPVCAAIISMLLSRLGTKAERLEVLNRIQSKLAKLPNNGHLEVWQQRMSYAFNPQISYPENLCKLVEGTAVQLWSNDWISGTSLKGMLDPTRIVNRTALRKLKPIVPRAEFSLFTSYP